MLIKYFYDDELAQASYLVGCTASGTALVIDPARDIRPYLEIAQKHGLSIDKVTETHIHADFVSGTRELAHATGAIMLLSDEGGDGWQYQFPDDTIQLLYDGDQFKVGNITFDVLHTPGHTPEHITLMVTDNGADHPMGLFTGDFVFVGDVGRPDLLDEATGQTGTREIGAQQQFSNIERLKQLPDYLQIWPGHGAGSSCGKALGAIPSTTLGYEKLFNPAFQFNQEDAFVEWLLEGQPEAPKYFAQMKKVNKQGAVLLETLHQPHRLDDVSPNKIIVIDTRSTHDFATQHIPNTINIPASSSNFSTYAGWYVDFDAPIQLIVSDDNVADVVSRLRAIGVDKIEGYVTPSHVKSYDGTVNSMTAQEVYDAGINILDVRATSEYNSEHIPNVQHIHMGYIPEHLVDITRDKPLAIHCGGGLRSQIVISILQKAGYDNLINMSGGISAWQKANLPLE